MSFFSSRSARGIHFIRAVVFFALLLFNLFILLSGRSPDSEFIIWVCVILGVYGAGLSVIALIEHAFQFHITVPYAKYLLMLGDLLLITILAGAEGVISGSGGSVPGEQYFIAYFLLMTGAMFRNDISFSAFTAVTAVFFYTVLGLAVYIQNTGENLPFESLFIQGTGLIFAGVVTVWTTGYLQKTVSRAAESRSLFEGAAHNIPGIIFQLEIIGDNQLLPRFISDSVFRVLKIEDRKERHPGLEEILSLVFGDSLGRLKELSLTAYTANGPMAMDVPLTFPGAAAETRQWFRAVISPSRDMEKRLINGLLLDIDEEKKIEEELVRAKEEAEKANRVKGEFLANMSHELRTPLNGVIGMVDLLMESRLNEEQSEYTETIRSSAEALLFIINDVLDFAKLEAGKLRIFKRDFHFHNLIQLVGETFYNQARDKGVDLYVDYDPRIPDYLHSDDNRIKQVLYNLVGNAVKFTNEGWIVIQVRLLHQTADEFSIGFIIEDTGIGIEKHALPGIFKKFTQADTSVTRKYGGTGLGLAICNELVTLLGGALRVHSKPGVGSTFEFSIPLGRDSSKETHFLPSIKDRSILLVDTVFSRRESIARFLTFYGAEVDTTASPAEPAEGIDTVIVLGGDVLDSCRQFDRHLSSMSRRRLTKICAADIRQRSAVLSELDDWQVMASPVDRFRLMEEIISMEEDDEYSSFLDSIRFDGKTILVAEDNPVNRQVLQRILEKLGGTVLLAENGREAIDRYSSSTDLIFMDCQMPVMDGIQAVEELRGRGVTIPIIALTGHALPGDRERFLAAGMSDYLTKPVKLQDIGAVLTRWLSQGGGHASEGSKSGISNGPEEVFSPEKAAEAIGGTSDDINEIMQIFLDDNIPRVRGFLEEYPRLSREECSAFFHRIKGAAWALHAVPFVSLCEKLEENSASYSQERFEAEIEAWHKSFQELIKALEIRLREQE